MGYIYLLTNLINNKKYVGQTISKNINNRWNCYKKMVECSIGRCLYNAFIKYSIKSFKFEIICICFDEDCNRYEEEYIKKLNTIVPNGYNLQSGGNNRRQHPESILKKTISMKNSDKYEEYKKNISIRMRGENNPNFGKKISEEQKIKTRETLKNNKVIKEKSEETKKKISDSLKKYYSENNISKLSKKIEKYSLDDKYIETYNSLSEASRNVENGYPTNIGKCCSNKYPHYKTYKGFIWKYQNS